MPAPILCRPGEAEAQGRILQLAESRQQARPDHGVWFHEQRAGVIRIRLLESISYLPNASYPSSFLSVADAYALPQIQLALKLIF